MPIRRFVRADEARLIVDVSTGGLRLPVSLDRIRDASRRVLRGERVRNALVSIAFVPDAQMARLNRRHLGHRGATDVISFAFATAGNSDALVGDIYIAPAVARRSALAHGAGIREELLRLVVHGTLHVAGHVHPENEARHASPMWRRQERLVRILTGTG